MAYLGEKLFAMAKAGKKFDLHNIDKIKRDRLKESTNIQTKNSFHFEDATKIELDQAIDLFAVEYRCLKLCSEY
jgi:hypothetical protein